MKEELNELLKGFNTTGKVLARTLEDVINRTVNYIDRLEAEIAHLKTELLCLNHDRDALLADRDMLKLCADQNEDEVKKIHAELKEAVSTACALRAEIDELRAEIDEYQAEREAMMQQKPLARGYKNSMTGTCSDLYWLGDAPEGVTYLYASPLPAQQIPEGYSARDSLDKFVESIGGYDSNAWHDYCADALYIKGFEAGRLSRMPVEPDINIINAIKSVKIACGFNGHDEELYTNASTHEANKLYKAMLSASKKGDV